MLLAPTSTGVRQDHSVDITGRDFRLHEAKESGMTGKRAQGKGRGLRSDKEPQKS